MHYPEQVGVLTRDERAERFAYVPPVLDRYCDDDGVTPGERFWAAPVEVSERNGQASAAIALSKAAITSSFVRSGTSFHATGLPPSRYRASQSGNKPQNHAPPTTPTLSASTHRDSPSRSALTPAEWGERE